MGDDSGRNGETELLRLAIELTEQYAGLDTHRARLGIHPDPFHRPEIDDHAVVADGQSGEAVSACPHGDQLVLRRGQSGGRREYLRRRCSGQSVRDGGQSTRSTPCDAGRSRRHPGGRGRPETMSVARRLQRRRSRCFVPLDSRASRSSSRVPPLARTGKGRIRGSPGAPSRKARRLADCLLHELNDFRLIRGGEFGQGVGGGPHVAVVEVRGVAEIRASDTVP